MRQHSQRVSTLDELGDPDAPVGSRAWAVYFLRQAKSARKDLDSDAHRLRKLLTELETGNASVALGVLSFGQLCSTELDLDAKQVQAIKRAKGGQALGAVLGPRGRPRKGEEKGSDRTFSRGENSAYLIARLDRSHPDIAERLRAGEYPSVRQAAIAAGIVKAPDPLESAVRAYRKLSHGQRKEFIAIIAEMP